MGYAFAALLVVAVVAACTSGDDDTEVAGAALERDQDDEPAAIDDPDDERTDPRVEDDADDGGVDDAAQDEAAQGEAEADEDEDSSDDEPADERGEAEDDADDGPGGSQDAAASDGDAGAGTTSGSAAGNATPPRPALEQLAAGEGLRGDQIGFGEDGTEVLGSGPLESPPAVGVRADALLEGDDAVSCRSFLQAPQERGLAARGELEIALDIGHHDGTSRRVPLMVMDLNVELAAGERHDLPRAPTAERGPYAFDRDRVASLACVATFRP